MLYFLRFFWESKAKHIKHEKQTTSDKTTGLGRDFCFLDFWRCHSLVSWLVAVFICDAFLFACLLSLSFGLFGIGLPCSFVRVVSFFVSPTEFNYPLFPVSSSSVVVRVCGAVLGR